MRIDVFTIFPEMVRDFGGHSLLGKAQDRGLLDLRAHDLREHATDVHRTVDDSPFGGGAGMVLMPEPVFAAVEAVEPPRPLFLLSPAGRRFDQRMAEELAASSGFSLLCGRYEGVDDRVRTHLCDGEVSLGDFVLNGGEVAAFAIVEAVARLVPGVMGNAESAGDESFSSGLLEYPQFTRPASFRGWDVPEVLRSGDHGRVDRWRRAEALARTARDRPDLIAARGGLSDDDVRLLADHGYRPGRWLRAPEEDRLSCGPRVRPDAAASTPMRALRSIPRRSTRAMKPTDLVDQTNLRDDVPDFAPGDTLKVHVRVVEGTRERVQIFQGAVIRRQGGGVQETFTVRKLSFGVGVERTFPVHSPTISKIEVVTRGDVRRAKLYYLRDRVGKSAKIKEKR